MRIALPTVRNSGLLPQRRLGQLARLVESITSSTSVDLIVLPELAACGYPGHEDLEADRRALEAASESLQDGPSAAQFTALARTASCAIVYGISERADGRLFNTVVVADAAGSVAGYRKIHLTPAETALWERGDTAVVVDAAIAGGRRRIGLSACYDKAFPLVAQRQRELGAELSIISSAWSSYPDAADPSEDVWAMQSALFDRGIAATTGMVVVSTNYTGPKTPGADERFCGGARVVDGLGWEAPVTRVAGDTPIWDIDVDAAHDAVAALNHGDFFTRDRRAIR